MEDFNEFLESVQQKEVPILLTSVEQKEAFRLQVRERILNGDLNPLQFYVSAKLVTDAIEDLKKDPDVYDCVSTEIAKYGKEKPTVNGSIVTSSQRSTPDYESCGDTVYNELKQKLKDREQFLKNLPPEGTVNPDTGELIKPPVFKYTTYITVKI
jgi:hypothetical protein